MARTSRDVTDYELAILQQLWDHGGRTIRQLAEALYPDEQPVTTAQYATVQKLLDRLAEKCFVSRNRSASPHVFTASIGRDDLIGRRLRDMAEKLCGGSLTPLLTHLVRGQRLSANERQELRDLIEADEKGNKRKS